MANSGKMTLGRTPHFSAVEKVPAFIDKGPYFYQDRRALYSEHKCSTVLSGTREGGT